MTSKNATQKLYHLKEIATEHLREKKYNEAAIYFKDILERFQSSISEITSEDEMEQLIRELELSAHKNLSLCYVKTGKYLTCVEQCKTILEIEPNNVKILFRIGLAQLRLDMLSEAEKNLKKAFYLDPQQKQIQKLLEEVESRQRKMREAAGQVERPTSCIKAIIIFLVSLFFWFPLFVWKKGKLMLAGAGKKKE